MADLGATIILTVALLMPGDEKNLVQTREMGSVYECVAAAAAWLEQDAQSAGGVGLAASCEVSRAPWRKSGNPQ